MSSISSGCYVIDQDYNVINVNETAAKIYPQLKVGEKCHRCLMGLDSPCPPCPVAAGRKGPHTYADPIRNIAETVDAVSIDIEGKGPCHMLIFSTVGTNEEYAATLPISSTELTDLAMVKALTSDYVDVFSVQISSGQITLFRQNGKVVPANTLHNYPVPYPEELNKYCKNYVLPEDQPLFLQQNSISYIQEQLKNQEQILTHYRVCLNGEIHYYFRKIARVGNADAFEMVVIGVGCEDEAVLERERIQTLQQHLEEIEIDSLTGLYTREAFLLKSEELLKKNPNLEFDFILCRLENLGMINHQYGKLAGNQMLSLIGQLLEKQEREDRLIAYFGDGTFASFSPNITRSEREKAVIGFRSEVLMQSSIKEIQLKWSIYTRVKHPRSFEEIIEKTLYALSIVRQNPLTDLIEFDQKVIDQMEMENTILHTFDQALENGEFIAWYQPKYELKTGHICGGEALVRWQKANGDMISPADFIPVLEKYGMVDRLDEYVFRLVCQLQQKLSSLHIPDLPISVNLSRASLFRRDIAGNYRAISDEYQVNRALLPIEITESAAVRAVSIRDFTTRLTEEGFSLHMDDFGAGYSSLSSLQSLPFSCIKLDRSLIENIGNSDSEKLLKHTVAFAKECEKMVIAEGVETYEQMMFLKVIGCNCAQGFYFSRPLPENEFICRIKI